MSGLLVHDGVATHLLADLEGAILDLARRRPGTASTHSVGAWKSPEDLLGAGGGVGRMPYVWPLMQEIARHAAPGTPPASQVWAMINRNGSSHPLHEHAHGRNFTCGVYYVTAGNPPVSTIFETVHGDRQERLAHEIAPVPGRLVLFPANLRHEVPVYKGDAPRITIAFECRW